MRDGSEGFMRTMAAVLGIAMLSCASVALGQQDSAWGNWKWLCGDWVGEGSGTPGQGTGWFSLHPDLGGKVLVRKGHAEYPKAQDRAEIVHDDLMIIYADPGGQLNKAIYFDNEGHVINYSIANSGESIVLVSLREKDVPLFRLTYSALDKDHVNITFEMSQDGEKFVTYTEGPCRRVK
jgi:hypothetical protein